MDNPAALSVSSKQLQTIVDRMSLALATIDEAIAWTDDQGCIQWCNAAFERLTNQSAVKLTTQPLPTVLPLAQEGDALPPSLHPAQLGLAMPQPQTGTYEFNRHDRTLKLALTVMPLPCVDHDCSAKGVMLIIRDVTMPPQSLERAALFSPHLAEAGDDRKSLEFEHQQTEAVRPESNQRFRNVFDTTTVGTVIVSPHGAFLQVNAAYCQLLGYTEAQLLTMTFQQVTHPDDLVRDLALVQKLATGELSYFYLEKRYLHQDGHLVWGLVSVSPIRDAHQQPLYYIAQVQDISDRKRAEAALRESEQWFRSVFDSTAIGMVIARPDGSVLQTNAAYCQMLGYTQTELATKTCQQLVHPDDFERSVEPLRKLLAGELSAYHTERRYFHKEGHVVWGLVSIATVRDGQAARYVVYQVQDISDRQIALADREQAETALRESETRLRLALEAAQMSTWDWDVLKNEVVYAGNLDPRFNLPSTPQSSAYEVFLRKVYRGDREYVRRALARALEGEDYNVEFRVTQSNGMQAWICSKGKAYFNRDGLPVRMLGVMREITRRKQAEQAYQRLHQELEQRVQDRTAQLQQTNQQLQVEIVAREQTEATLRQSEERFRILFDHAPIAISLSDAHTYHIVKVNRAHHELLGYSKTDLETLTHVAMTHPDDANKDLVQIQQLRAGKITRFQMEKRFVKKSGEWIWTNLTVALIRDPDGRAYMMGMLEDITDRKHAEDALLDNQRFLQLVIDNVPNRIFWKDRNLRYLGCNRRFAIDAGLATPKDIIGKTDFELPWTVHAERSQLEDWQVLTSKQPTRELEGTFVRAGGEQRWIKTCKVPLHDKSGSVVGVLGAYEDITRRRQTDQALRLTQFSIDRAVDPIWWVQSDGSIYYVNDAACRDLGYPRDVIIGKKVTDFNPDRPVETWVEHWQTVKDQGSLTFETRLRAKGGTFFPVEVTANYIELNGKEYHCSFVRNITKRKQAEAQLRASLLEKEDLLKEVHHRVKNNLQMVSSLLNLQLDTIQDPKVLAPLQDSQRRIKAMILVHERLYRSDRLETVNFSDYVHHLVTDLIHSYSADSDKIRLMLELTQLELPLSAAIPCGLIINELVTNALKHAFPGDRTGNIYISFSVPTNQQCLLVIADDGVGFLGSMASFNAAQPMNSLGLQLVHAFSHQLRGTIELNCSHGTRFELSFPYPTPGFDER